MSEPVKKKRIRSSDLLKSSRCVGESKYDFSKIIQLKGAAGRDVSKKGRPEGITSTSISSQETSSTSTIPVDATFPTTNMTSTIAHEQDIELMQTEEIIGNEDQNSICFLSQEETYRNLLKEHNSIYCVDDLFKTFVLKEFDNQRLRLKTSQFLFVSRRAMSFMGDFHFVYTCSCDTAASDLIHCCGAQMDVPFDEFKTRIPGCIHTNVVAALLEQFDAQNMIDPSNFDETDDDTDTNVTDGNQAAEEQPFVCSMQWLPPLLQF